MFSLVCQESLRHFKLFEQSQGLDIWHLFQFFLFLAVIVLGTNAFLDISRAN